MGQRPRSSLTQADGTSGLRQDGKYLKPVGLRPDLFLYIVCSISVCIYAQDQIDYTSNESSPSRDASSLCSNQSPDVRPVRKFVTPSCCGTGHHRGGLLPMQARLSMPTFSLIGLGRLSSNSCLCERSHHNNHQGPIFSNSRSRTLFHFSPNLFSIPSLCCLFASANSSLLASYLTFPC